MYNAYETAEKMLEVVNYYKFTATPVYNTIAMSEGAPQKLMGYNLKGPRGNKTNIAATPDGYFSMREVCLWVDKVNYSTRKLEARKSG